MRLIKGKTNALKEEEEEVLVALEEAVIEEEDSMTEAMATAIEEIAIMIEEIEVHPTEGLAVTEEDREAHQLSTTLEGVGQDLAVEAKVLPDLKRLGITAVLAEAAEKETMEVAKRKRLKETMVAMIRRDLMISMDLAQTVNLALRRKAKGIMEVLEYMPLKTNLLEMITVPEKLMITVREIAHALTEVTEMTEVTEVTVATEEVADLSPEAASEMIKEEISDQTGTMRNRES